MEDPYWHHSSQRRSLSLHRAVSRFRLGEFPLGHFATRESPRFGDEAHRAPFDFDALAQELARGLSRREALHCLAGGLAAVLLATLGLPRIGAADPGGNSACAHWCDNLPPSADTDHCKSDAAHGQGLCFQCGPAAPAGHPDVCSVTGLGVTCCPAPAPNCCNGRCTNVLGDSSNCGRCGSACPAGESCQGGQCAACIATGQSCDPTATNQCCFPENHACDPANNTCQPFAPPSP